MDLEAYAARHYTYEGATTNYIDILQSKSDMLALQACVDEYLALWNS
jgi:hypothetical protein